MVIGQIIVEEEMLDIILEQKFVQYLCGKYSFEHLIKIKIDDISQESFRFAEENRKYNDTDKFL